MKIHAAMIDRMDAEIGRVLLRIEQMGKLDDTIIVFLSDNGASAEIMVRDDGHDPKAAPGSAPTYLCLGPGWSTICNTPFRRHKTWVHEGGISTPMIFSWPKGLPARGEIRRTPAHIIDLPATLLDLAGIDLPEEKPLAGRSLRAALADDTPLDRDALWWCHDDHRAVRVGDWKLVAAKGDPWELYDLSRDRAEQNDLSDKHPGRATKLEALWEKMMAEFAADARSGK
jgi:arylsulfatase